MTEIKYVIGVGRSIPDDVTEMQINNGDVAWRAHGGWHIDEKSDADGHNDRCAMAAEEVTDFAPLTVTAVRQPVPERTLIGPPHAHLDAPCTDKCYETASAEPEPQQADASALLDLVRQYGQARWSEGTELDGGTSWREARTEADFQFDRIAALVQPDAPDFLASINKLTIERDGERQARSEQFVELVKARGEREDALAEIDRLQGTTLGRVVVERDEARAEVEQLKAMLVEIAPDPSVLSLPQVPDGATLIGKSGERYERTDDTGWWRNGPHSEYVRTLGTILDTDAPVTVVMREPRTWPKLDGAPEDLKAVKGASGIVYPRDPSGLDIFGACRLALATLQRTDGPLTEVFEDEPGGEPR